MIRHINKSIDIECDYCKKWIWKGDYYVVGYDDTVYHPVCYENKRMELIREYVEVLNKDKTPENKKILIDIEQEYNDFTAEDIKRSKEFVNLNYNLNL